MTFSHLHVHSHGSMLDSVATPKDIAQRASELGMGAVAITDHGNVFNAIEFYEECQKRGVKPVLGCEFNFVESCDASKKMRERDATHIVLLAENNDGWRNIVKLISLSNSEQAFYYRPRIDIDMLRSHSDGIIALTACAGGVVAAHLRERRNEEGDIIEYKNIYRADAAIRMLLDIFDNDHLFLEVQDVNTRVQRDINDELRKLALKHGLKTVATCNVHYIDSDDIEAHKALTEIGGGHIATSFGENRDLFMKSRDDLTDLVTEDEIDITGVIAERCNVSIDLSKDRLPRYPYLPDGVSAMEQLRKLVGEGAQRLRLPDMPNAGEYRLRAKKELDDIEQLGFADYFLIVADVINWAREQGILVGPGRGSAGGSLVSYALGITDIDPLEYGLIWERFLNIGRKSLPDIDSDIPRSKRGIVIDYIRERYGNDHVAQLATFNKLAARAVLKDVFKVFGMDFEEANKITKLLPMFDEDHVPITLPKAIHMVPALQDYEDRYKAWFKIARSLEGCYKSLGTHSAAVVIADHPFEDGEYPLCRSADASSLVFSWDMDVVDKLHLLKLDILGLSTLDVIQDTFDLIEANDGTKLSISSIPLNNQKTFDLLSDGKTVGVFQLEKQLGKTWSKAVKPQSVEDISDLISIIRPGPLETGMADQYKAVGDGECIPSYPSQLLKPILDKTRGALIYQEQIIEICRKLAKMSLVDADLVRKAMGKKKPEEMRKWKGAFVNGCKDNNISEIVADEVWSWIERFAGYGFNKCVSCDTIVLRSGANQHSSREITLAELWRYYHGDLKNTATGKKYRNRAHPKLGLRIMAMKDGRIKPDRIADVVQTGVKTTYRLELESGEEIRSTLDHKFWTANGWKRLADIRIGDQVYVSGEYESTTIEESRRLTRFSNVTANERTFKSGVQYYRNGEANSSYIDGGYTAFKSERRRRIDVIDACEQCGEQSDRYELAHLDGDHTNQTSNNLMLMCAGCHKRYDYEYNNRKRRFDKGYPTHVSSVVSIDDPQEEMTYDIEMCGDEHNYVANGIVTHNSHGIGYGLLGYYTAYLKANYPSEFFCASLRSARHAQDTAEEIKKFVHDARLFGIHVIPPKATKGNVDFDIVDDNKIAFGLSSLKGVGDKAIPAVQSSASNTSSFDDFLFRAKDNKVNRRVMDAMILSGALDEFDKPRNQMLARYQLMSALTANELDTVRKYDRDWVSVIRELADENTFESYKTSGIRVPNSRRRETIRDLLKGFDAVDMFDREIDKVSWERTYLGISLTASLASVFRTQNVCSDVVAYGGGNMPVEVAVVVNKVKEFKTKQGNLMGFMTAGDETYELDNFVIFPGQYERFKAILESGNILKVRGNVNDRGSVVVTFMEKIR